MKIKTKIRRAILSAAIAATMSFLVTAVAPPPAGASTISSDASVVAFVAAEKGSDGQETHG